MSNPVLVLNEDVTRGLGIIREYAEKIDHWVVVNSGCVRVNEYKSAKWMPDYTIGFVWVLDGADVMRHFTITLKEGVRWLDAEHAYTLAHLLGCSGAQVNESGIAVEPGSNWRVRQDWAGNRARLTIQQDVRRLAAA